MASEKLVLIIGAGASKEFNLPTGLELKNQISQFLDVKIDSYGKPIKGNANAHRQINHLIRSSDLILNTSTSSYYNAAKLICENMAITPSIDNFLNTHKENIFVGDLGKLAIAQLIIKGESESHLFYGNASHEKQINFSSVAQTWLGRLFTILATEKDYKSFGESLKRIKFISFNYDRCIQQFFWCVIRSYFDKAMNEVEELVSNLDIDYVYGSVGKFEINSNGVSTYGDENSVLAATKSIKTFTEGSAPEFRLGIKGALDGAKAVVFLGFGFLQLNLEVLFGEESFEVGKVLGTGKGLPPFTTEDVKLYLQAHLLKRKRETYSHSFDFPEIHISDHTCTEFINAFERIFKQ